MTAMTTNRFTQSQIEAAYAKVKSGADYPKLVQDLKRLGIRTYDHIVSDGSNAFRGDQGHTVTTQHLGPAQPPIAVADHASTEKLKHYIAIHQQGQTHYAAFCGQAGEAGVAKWVSDLEKMTCTYLDKANHAMLVEPIPVAGY